MQSISRCSLGRTKFAMPHVALYNTSPDNFYSVEQYARIAINCITFIKLCQNFAFIAHILRWLLQH